MVESAERVESGERLERLGLSNAVRLSFFADLDWVSMPDGLGIQVRGTETPLIFRGRVAHDLVEHVRKGLDRGLTIDQLVHDRPAHLERSSILRTLVMFIEHGIVHDRIGDVPPQLPGDPIGRQRIHWTRLAARAGFPAPGSPDQIQARLANTAVLLIGSGDFGSMTYELLVRSGCTTIDATDWDDDGQFLTSIASNPIPPRRSRHFDLTDPQAIMDQVTQWTDESPYVVTATMWAPDRLFEDLDRHCREYGLSWLRGDFAAERFEVGPYVLPGQKGCFTCMRTRETAMRRFPIEEHLYQEHLARSRPAGALPLRGESSVFAAAGASLVAAEVVRTITGVWQPTTRKRVLTYDPVRGHSEWNHFLPVPDCPICGRDV